MFEQGGRGWGRRGTQKTTQLFLAVPLAVLLELSDRCWNKPLSLCNAGWVQVSMRTSPCGTELTGKRKQHLSARETFTLVLPNSNNRMSRLFMGDSACDQLEGLIVVDTSLLLSQLTTH